LRYYPFTLENYFTAKYLIVDEVAYYKDGKKLFKTNLQNMQDKLIGEFKGEFSIGKEPRVFIKNKKFSKKRFRAIVVCVENGALKKELI